MSYNAIEVRDLNKRYRIGVHERKNDTMIGSIVSWLKSPLENYKQLKRLSSFKEGEDTDDVIWALRDISFDVAQGEVLGIIGHNGAGKSTLLKVLSRITEPTSGWADINGRISSLLEVGTGFHPELTGRENVYLNGTILGMTKAEIDRKFDEIVDFSGVEKFIDTPVKRYSSGMKVRLAFSVAAHLEPEILLIDEVLSVGDAAFQKKSMGKMNDVADEGRTVLFVSHNMVAVQTLCPRAIWLENGRIKEIGDTSLIVRDYLSVNDESETIKRWETPEEAPGDDAIRVHEIRVVIDEAGNPGQVDMDSDFQVSIQYWNHVPDARLHTTIKVINDEGILVFGSGSGEAKNFKHEVGLFQSTCRIPGKLLNSGSYYVNLLAVREGNRVVARLNQVVSFEVIDVGTRETSWYKKEPGVIRPQLHWDVEKLEEAVLG